MSVKKELNRYLHEMTKAELEKEVSKLYTKFKSVKQYYELELSGDTSKILANYKSKLKKEYFPSRGYGKARSGESRKVITAFKKISIHNKDVIELLLYRAEMMLAFTNAYGDIDEAFYNSLASSYYEACELIKKEKLEKEFQHICQGLLDDAAHLGWGVPDDLQEGYDMCYDN